MSKKPLCDGAEPRVPILPSGARRRSDVVRSAALAAMCASLGREDHLKLFKRIAEAGPDGVEACEAGDVSAVEKLVAARVVTPVCSAGRLRYRAERDRLTGALAGLLSP